MQIFLLFALIGLSCTTQAFVFSSSVADVVVWSLEACTSPWQTVTGFSNRAIRATEVQDQSGVASNGVPLNNDPMQNNEHSHTFSLSGSLSGIAGAQPDCDTTGTSSYATSQSQSWTQSNKVGTTETQYTTEIYPSVRLFICRLTGSTKYFLPVDAIFGLRTANTSCPVGTTTLTDVEGRFLVFGASTVNLASALKSGGPVPASGDPIMDHTHSLTSATVPVQAVTSFQAKTCTPTPSTPRFGIPGNLVLSSGSGASGSKTVGIRYQQMNYCVVTDSSNPTSSPVPPSNLIFFFQGNDCPTNWIDVTLRGGLYSNLAGRLIVHSNGTFGASTIGEPFGRASAFSLAVGAPTTPDVDAHTHTIFNDAFYVSARVCGGVTTCTSPTLGSQGPYTAAYTFDPYPAGDYIPYRVMRGCTTTPSSQAPSAAPSLSPLPLSK